MDIPNCATCGSQFPPRRAELGYKTCLKCGEASARGVKHTIVPGHKQGYMVVTNREELVGINNKCVR